MKNNKIFIAGIFLTGIALLVIFVYVPKYREIGKLRQEYRNVETNIKELYDYIGGDDKLKDSILKMREQLMSLENTFPNEKDISNIIKGISEEAKRFGVNVVSMRPKDIRSHKLPGGGVISIANYICRCMPLTLDVESGYKSLGEFLIALKQNKKPLITIEEVSIQNDGTISPRLKANIDITAYVLGE